MSTQPKALLVFQAQTGSLAYIVIVGMYILLLVARETDLITRYESYIASAILILLMLPFDKHSLEITEEGINIRYSIIPRRKKLAWSELAAISYITNGDGEAARLILQNKKGRRYRATLRLTEVEKQNEFHRFLDFARGQIGRDAVANKTTRINRFFVA